MQLVRNRLYHILWHPLPAIRAARLHFTRQESSACSEQVLFPDFNQHAALPEGETVTLEVTPPKPGEHGFQ